MNWKRVAKSVRDHVWGPVGSVLFHGAIILLVVAWSGRPREPVVVSEVALDVRAPEKEIELDQPITPPPKLVMLDPKENPVNEPANQSFVSDPAEVATTTSEQIAGPSGVEGLDVDMPRAAATLDLAQLNLSGPLGWRSAQQVDRNAGPKNSAPGPTTKGPDETAAALHRALRWLKDQQAEDGSWGPNKVAMTGLALLTFLGQGETSGSKEFGMTVRRAIDWLAAHQRDDGIFAMGKQMGQPTVYEHAIATYAISEAYGMTRRPDLRGYMEKGTAVIVAGQQAGGLWDYEFKKSERWDTSVSGWQVQALKAAFVNGAEVNGLAAAIAKSADGMKSAQSADSGFFGYSQTGQGKIGMTGVGALCLELAGHSGTPSVKLGIAALRGIECDWKKPAPWPLYTWYYVTQALYHDNGAAWGSWSRKLLKELAHNQNTDGSWNSPTGSGNDNEESKHGPVYSTTLAALSLSAPARYAPVSQSMHSERNSKPRRPADEAVVEII